MLTWPRALLNPGEERPRIAGASSAGGGSLSGTVQTVATSGGGLWVWEFEVSLGTPEKIKTWRALEALLDSGATQFVLPMCDKRFAPVQPTETDHSDGMGFSDGAAYVGVSTIVTTREAPLRATTLYLAAATAGIEAGQHFTVEHATKGVRLYRVAGVADDGLSMTIRPPLREAIASGEPLDFASPRCTMNLRNPDGFAASLRMNRYGRGNASFSEAF